MVKGYIKRSEKSSPQPFAELERILAAREVDRLNTDAILRVANEVKAIRDESRTILADAEARIAEKVNSIPLLRGERGLTGLPGRSIEGRPGRDGRDADEQAIKAWLIEYFTKNHVDEARDRKLIDEVLKEHLKKDKGLTTKDIMGLNDELRVMKKNIQQGSAYIHGGGSTVFYTDLSSQLNDVTKDFVLGATVQTSRIVSVNYSSMPFIFRPTIDYTFFNRTLSFTTDIVAPAAGQTLIVTWIK